MKHTPAVVEQPVNPTVLTSKITIKGRTYTMCFDLGALAKAEHQLNAEGHDVNLLRALPTLNLENTRIVFAASIRKFHPEISFPEALELLTLPYVLEAAAAIGDAWTKCLADREDEGTNNPTQPGK